MQTFQPSPSPPSRLAAGVRGVLQEDLGEARLAVDLRDRPDAHARRLQREQDQRQAAVPFRGRVGAEEAERPVGEHGAR